jgi:hypothetical protein
MLNQPPVEALLRNRSVVIGRWSRQVDATRAGLGRAAVVVGDELLGSLFDEIMAMLGETYSTEIPRCHPGEAFDRLAAFPESVTLCIDVLQGATQAIGAFVVENSGPSAAWSVAARNETLARLDSVFHILVHREIQALCELSLRRQVESASVPAVAASGRVRLGRRSCSKSRLEN